MERPDPAACSTRRSTRRSTRHSTRRSIGCIPAVATTLVAAALTGELLAGPLAPVEAGAQTDDPTPRAAEVTGGSDHPSEGSGPSEGTGDPGDDAPAPADPSAGSGATAPTAGPVAPVESAIPVRSGFAAASPSPASAPGAGAATSVASRDGRRGEAPGSAGRDDRAAPALPRSKGDGGSGDDPSGPTSPSAVDLRGVARRPVPSSPAAAPGGSVSTQHVVAPGEHLWGIAAAHLAARSGREASALAPEEIAPYWTRLCMVNAERLRSRDPNLVHPGEVVQLPAL